MPRVQSPGRKVLIATSAAEEGMDVPACEFVVRYNAASTGIQLVQSRGRARQRASEFVAILQVGELVRDWVRGVFAPLAWCNGYRYGCKTLGWSMVVRRELVDGVLSRGTSARVWFFCIRACPVPVPNTTSATPSPLLVSRSCSRPLSPTCTKSNTLDEHLHRKSRLEEANMVWYQRNHATVEQQLLQQLQLLP